MTLLTTEIHFPDEPDKALIVFAADRRISRGAMPVEDQTKIVELLELNILVGFFGLAEVPIKGRSIPMADWLEDFLNNLDAIKTLEQLAENLGETLNAQVPLDCKKEEISGFHIAGFNSKRLPEFWYVRNVADDRETPIGEYRVREDFQRRDAKRLPSNAAHIYRNGDIRAHVEVWKKIDRSFGKLLNTQDFRQLTTPDEYKEWVRFKMEMIVNFYEEFCTRSIIGGQVDALVITSE